MKLILIGNVRSPYSTESDLLKTLRIMGHDVDYRQEDLDRALVRDDVDLILWCHSHGWELAGAEELVEQKDIPVVAFTLDLFRGLKRHDEKYVETHPWFRCGSFWQPDEPDWLRERGVNALWSPPAVLSTSCYVAAPDPLHPAFGKVVFVGSRTYHPEWGWRTELLEWLAGTYGDGFKLFEHSSGMRGHALNVLYASASVVVGDSCFASPDSAYTSDRLFESLGRGANLVYPNIKWSALGGDQLRHHVHTYEPGNFASLADAIQEARDVEQGDWRTHQVRYIARHHTYEERLRAILDAVAKEAK